MQIDEIRAIVEMMSRHNLSEFKIEAEDMRMSLKRGIPSAQQAAPAYYAPQQMMQMPQYAQQQTQSAPAPQQSSAPSANDQKPQAASPKNTIDAPIVGTFYSSPSPEKDNYVKVGDKVSPDTIVCIIEAMKVMNEIKAEKEGTVKEILVKNSQSVEYGTPLFVIE